MYVLSATQSRSGRSAAKARWTRSGAGRAAGSPRVVVTKARRLTPVKPAACMRRATRWRPMWIPRASRSAGTRGAPYVPRARSWIARICSMSARSAWARAERGRDCHA